MAQTRDEYFAELEAKEERDEQQAKAAYMYGGGYEASRGDWEGACLARAEYEAGEFS